MQQILSHTALRGIAAVLVVYGHYADVFGRDVAGRDFFVGRTYLGVDLFFMLSGFILTLVYGRAFAGGVSAAGWRQFMQRRLARIYPLHLATLLAVIVLLRFEIAPQDFGLLWQNMALVHAWGLTDRFAFNAPSWSISCEFAGYLLFPFLMLALRSRAGVAGLIVVALLGYAGLWGLGAGSLDLDAIGRQAAMLRMVAAFPVGIVLGHLVARGARVPLGWASAAQAAVVLALVAGVWAGLPDIMLMVPLAGLVFVTARPEGGVSRLLRGRVWQGLGEISYGIYLIQWPVMLLMFSLRPKLGVTGLALDLMAAGVFVGLTLGAAVLSYHWFERPLVTLARGKGGLSAPPLG